MNDGRPLGVALLDDVEIVVQGLVRMLEPFADRVTVVDVTPGERPDQPVDVALHDPFVRVAADGGPAAVGPTDDLAGVLDAVGARRLAIYSWRVDDGLVEAALRRGASGYLGKRLPAGELVEALERIAAGEVVVSRDEPRARPDGDWPGRAEGLTTRESEVVSLIAQGLSNQQIADRTYLSINSVKSYIRSAYRKMAVTSRSQAVLWGLQHGFRPGHAAPVPTAHPETPPVPGTGAAEDSRV